MNVSKKAYKAKKRVSYIRIIEAMVILSFYTFLGFLLLFYDFDMIRRHFYLYSSMGFIFGCLFIIVIHELIWNATRPAARICEHFFILEYGYRIVEWDEIEKIKLKEKGLNLYVSKKSGRTHAVSFSDIENTEELIEVIRTMCKTKGIAFETVSENTEDIESLQGEY
ncbi:MAG: hypothetical protein HXS52_10190 [Theionarchaea archaeon]|nr:hypothetical protein [Theionarchaea archaeon]